MRLTLFATRYGSDDYPTEVVASYPVGQRVDVYYDPRNPRQSILRRGNALPMAAFITVLGLYFCVAIARWFFR